MSRRSQVTPTLRPPSPPRPCAGLVIFALLLTSCAPRQIIVERAPQAFYQTGFPIYDTSRQLERIARSVKRLYFTAEYRTFVFTKEAGVTEADDFQDPAVLGRAVDTLTDSESKSGTAAILSVAPRSLALVTNEHVVQYPAMRIQYFDERPVRRRGRAPPRRIASISIRTRERGALADHPDLGMFQVIARDSVNDIALIHLPIRDGDNGRFATIPVAMGDPTRLSWGSFVYVLGYPRGYPMVNFGIVSDPNRDRQGSFLTNGLWNEGISGGAILAVRGDNGSLEWVGIARAGAGTAELRVQPSADRALEEFDLPVLYQGPIFVESILRIQYGITFSVSMTQIRSFIARHRGTLTSRGHDVRVF